MSEIGQVANKGADMVLKYAPAAIGISVGYLVGDVLDISAYLAGAIVAAPGSTPAQMDWRKIVRAITAGIYTIIGIMVWNWAGGNAIGTLIAGFFIGIALRGVVGIMKGG